MAREEFNLINHLLVAQMKFKHILLISQASHLLTALNQSQTQIPHLPAATAAKLVIFQQNSNKTVAAAAKFLISLQNS
jgi:hypothetical protein